MRSYFGPISPFSRLKRALYKIIDGGGVKTLYHRDGGNGLVDKAKFFMGVLAKGRKGMKLEIHIKFENLLLPIVHFSGKKDDIGSDNTWLWDGNL